MEKQEHLDLQTLLTQLYEQQKVNIELQKLNAAHQATILKMSEQMEQLQQRIDKLLQLLYGVKSEKRKRPEPPSTGSSSKPPKGQKNSKNKSANRRRQLPPEFPRVRVEHDVPEKEQQCHCCLQKMRRMGEAISFL
jgi:Skp family chaperone for outer membrane proteins